MSTLIPKQPQAPARRVLRTEITWTARAVGVCRRCDATRVTNIEGLCAPCNAKGPDLDFTPSGKPSKRRIKPTPPLWLPARLSTTRSTNR